MYVTYVLIALNVIIYFALSDSYLAKFGLNILFFWQDMYWQILTSMFLHGGIIHLLLNMGVLYQFGTALERFLGSARFIGLYIIGGLLCSVLSAFYLKFTFDDQHFVNIVGASGAICVLIGFYARIDKSQFASLLIQMLLISFVPLLFDVNIAWYAHIFGFICGYVIAMLFIKYYEVR